MSRFDDELANIIRDLRNAQEQVAAIDPTHPALVSLSKAILMSRKALDPDHPMHPNQDQDDVPELGDPRA